MNNRDRHRKAGTHRVGGKVLFEAQRILCCRHESIIFAARQIELPSSGHFGLIPREKQQDKDEGKTNTHEEGQ
jgi:hypothetical protein